jgi:hypothetical protein
LEKKFQIRTIFDHLAPLFCPQNGHFLTKMALFFWQSMGTQNGNLTHFKGYFDEEKQQSI